MQEGQQSAGGDFGPEAFEQDGQNPSAATMHARAVNAKHQTGIAGELRTALLGGLDGLHKDAHRLAVEITGIAWNPTVEAALDVLETIGPMCHELCEALRAPGDGETAREAIVAVRDTLALVNVNKAAETGVAQPADRDAVVAGLAAIIQERREALGRLDKTLTVHTGIPPHSQAPAHTLPDPVATTWRTARRDLARLVEAWDVL